MTKDPLKRASMVGPMLEWLGNGASYVFMGKFLPLVMLLKQTGKAGASIFWIFDRKETSDCAKPTRINPSSASPLLPVARQLVPNFPFDMSSSAN